eukprot:COSAG01_NODE_9461_length_2441_cov_1.419300_4_plen_69_part_00
MLRGCKQTRLKLPFEENLSLTFRSVVVECFDFQHVKKFVPLHSSLPLPQVLKIRGKNQAVSLTLVTDG